MVANLNGVLTDNGSEVMPEKSKLSAAVIIVNVIEYKAGIGNEQLVSVLFVYAPEQLKFGVAPVTAKVVNICIITVSVEKIDKLEVSVTVFECTMKNHHTAERLVCIGLKYSESDFVFILSDKGDDASVHEKDLR